MRLYFAGAEVPGWRSLLAAQGARHVEMSYHGMRRRRASPAPIAECTPDGTLEGGAPEVILLNSGGYSFNKNETDYSREQLLELAADYATYVAANIDDIALYTELDVARLGTDWITAQRRQVWDHISPDKLMVIWHPEDGLGELQRLCDTYTNVAITQTALGTGQQDQQVDLSPHLPRIIDSTGVRLHGLAMTKPDLLEQVPFSSVSSTSWLSPSHYGDTIVFNGQKLKRYPKKYKERARAQHRQRFIEAGLDADAIADDDSTEVLRLSIWSWRSYLDHLNSRGQVTTPWNESPAANTEIGDPAVGGPLVETRNGQLRNARGDMALPPRTPPRRRDHQVLPVVGFNEVTDRVIGEDGGEEDHVRTELHSVPESLRACDSCFLAARGCPGYEQGAACVYKIPVNIRTDAEDLAAKRTLLEIQLHRIMFAKMAEDMAGGYPDANLSAELDRYMRMAKTVADSSSGYSLKIEARGDAPAAGIMSRIFSPQVGERMRELPEPVPSDQVMQQIIAGEAA